MTDDELFDQMCREHYAYVVRLVARRGPDLDAQGLAHEAFMIAIKKWRAGEIVPADKCRPWLAQIVNNIVNNEIRKLGTARREYARVPPLGNVDAASDPADDVVRRLALQEALDGLDEGDRRAIELIAWEDMTVAQAAEATGQKRTTLFMRLTRGNPKLDELLKILGRRPHA